MEPLIVNDIPWHCDPDDRFRVEDHEPRQLLLLDDDDPVLIYIEQLQQELRIVREFWHWTLDAAIETSKALAREKAKNRRA